MDGWNQYVVTIAELTICFYTEQKIAINDNFRPFCSKKEPDYTIWFYQVEELKEFPTVWAYEGISYVAAPDGHGGYWRMFRDAKRNNRPYATAEYDWTNRRINVEYLPGSMEFVCEIESCFFHIAWEAVLMHENRILLHSALVDTTFGGILFSGPSGIGKSTQADLWCRFRNGRLLNGDRAVLHPENGRWMAYGSPYAGSSRCYINEKCQVRAIVMLKQAEQCSLRNLGSAEGFRKVFSGLTVNSWDMEFVSFAADYAETIAMQIPIYELSCTPDENAVKILENELKDS